MADFKSMYYHLAGRTATAVDVLEATVAIMDANARSMVSAADAMIASSEAMKSSSESMLASVAALADLKDKLKLAQQLTEEMFISGEDDE